MALNFYNITEILKLYYNLVKILDNIEKKNKILIDYYRNKMGATSVCPYSLRLKDNASISFPISWEDIKHIKPDTITIRNVKKYLEKDNPWSDFFD